MKKTLTCFSLYCSSRSFFCLYFKHGRYEPGAGAAAPPQKKKLGQLVFWAMTKILAEGAFGVSNIAPIHVGRAHANFVLENEMERIIDIFGSRTGRDSYIFFLV